MLKEKWEEKSGRDRVQSQKGCCGRLGQVEGRKEAIQHGFHVVTVTTDAYVEAVIMVSIFNLDYI